MSDCRHPAPGRPAAAAPRSSASRHGEGAGAFDSVQAGRYVDRFEKRDDEWRIANRKVIVDWFREYSDAGDWEKGPLGNAGIRPGERHPTDYSYTAVDLS